MPDRDIVSWASLLQAFVKKGDLSSAKRLFDLMPRWNVVVFNSMVSGFANLGDLSSAESMFAWIPEATLRDNVSWNVMLAAYSQAGDLEEARRLFSTMPERNTASWNTLIGGEAYYGEHAMDFFRGMCVHGLDASEISFLNCLVACNHKGHIEQACNLFLSMSFDHNLEHWEEHFSLMVDVLGRTGQLNTAKELVQGMPLEPNVGAQGALFESQIRVTCTLKSKA
ncbi:hypothetical protein SELMODRAFT_86341 [Selaginella moellendorffii]|uniref:Pentacotripeptide-repeat region of PRORP domain-containing protein n=1 Tax=Selaginella moellendorffii TaxID=88036 RepID=D8R6N8_SELML|nr:hypothetical protein SELMODRAFT_86341 [Selaginella moellendorffii]